MGMKFTCTCSAALLQGMRAPAGSNSRQRKIGVFDVWAIVHIYSSLLLRLPLQLILS